MSDIPDDVYKKYSIRSEYSLFVDLKDCIKRCSKIYKIKGGYDSYCDQIYQVEKTSNFSSDGKTWTFTYSPSKQTLQLEMSTHSSDRSKTITECIWYWKEEEIAIMKKTVHAFGVDSRNISVSTIGITPVNKKFHIVIRFLDDRISSENNSLESYYGDNEGVETITLCVAGTESEAETSFKVPKYALIFASPVFRRMFASEMTEKTTGKVDIKDTNPTEFADFLKAISPKQEHPNPSNVMDLLKLADRYEIQSLRDRCETHLLNCVEIPRINMLTCADFYGLNKLKANLLMSIEGTNLHKLFQQSKPHFGMLSLLVKMDDELMKESSSALLE